MKSIDERIKDLPPALKKEVEEFVNSLLKKRRKKNGKSSAGQERLKKTGMSASRWMLSFRQPSTRA